MFNRFKKVASRYIALSLRASQSQNYDYSYIKGLGVAATLGIAYQLQNNMAEAEGIDF